MSCEVLIYKSEYINDDNDIIFKYIRSVCGYPFLEALPFDVKIGYNSVKYSDLVYAFKESHLRPEFTIEKEAEYVINVSY